MTKSLRTILLLAAFIAAPFPSASEETFSKWTPEQFYDDIHGYVSMSTVSALGSSIHIREIQGEVRVFVVPGEPFYCRIGDSWKISANFIIDGKRFDRQILTLSDNQDALFFEKRDTSFWIKNLNEGETLKMRFTDGCSDTITLEFDIRGHTHFGG